MPRTQCGHGEGRRNIGQVEHGSRVQVYISLAIARRYSYVCGIRHHILMREHDALSASCRSPCIKQTREIVIVHLLVNTFLHGSTLAHHIVIVNHPQGCFITNVYDMTYCRDGITTRDVTCKGLVYYQHLTFTIVENEHNLRSCQPNVERHNHSSHTRTGIIQLQIAMAIQHQYGHPISALYIESCQTPCQCVSSLIKIIPHVAYLATRYCLMSSENLSGMCQSLCNVHVGHSF